MHLIRLLIIVAMACFAGGPVVAQAQVAVPADAAAAPGMPDAALANLLDVLRDDTAREALIAQLEEATRPEAAAPAEPEDTGPTSIGGQIAEVTGAAAERTADALAEIPRTFRSAQRLLRGLDGETWGAIYAAALNLALVIAVTVGVFILLRRFAVPILRRIGEDARGAGPVRAVVTLVGSFVIRVATVVVAWAIGYGVMTLLVGEFGRIGFNQTLFLNAFLVVELIKVVVRTLISPASDDLRLLPMSDGASKRLTFIAAMTISILGYGILLVVPIVDEAVSFFAARAMSVLVMEVALVYLAIVVIWHARPVGDWLVKRLLQPVTTDPDDTVTDPPRKEGFLAGLLRVWHWAALGWLAYLFSQAFSRSVASMGEIVAMTLQVAGAAFAGAAVMGLLGRRMRAGVSLPQSLNEKLPTLEGRLNRVVPRVLLVLRALIAVAIAVFALDMLGWTNMGAWLVSDAGSAVLGNVVSVAIILVVAWGLWLGVSSWIEYRLNPDAGQPPSSREITLLTLLKNAVTVAIVIFAVMFSLSEIGLNIGPLIASAGVLGLAIGFGAQKLVQDIITGVFIQFENAINVGDVVTVGGTTGGVEKLTVRSVTLRDLHGVVHIVPFSSVDMVSNFTREFSYFVCDMGIAYRESVEEAKQAMFDAFDLLRADEDQGVFVLGDLEYFGLNTFGDNAVVLRARVKTWPGKQWGVGRAYNGYLKTIFDDRGIEIPFPHRTIYFGEAKDGTIQTVPVHTIADAT